MPFYKEHPRIQLDCSNDKGRTKQCFKDECDINILTARWLRGQEMPIPTGLQNYGDFTGVDDFLQAQIQLKAAQQAFDNLPSRIRNRFQNDPAKLIEFLEEPDNLEEARQLGLAEPAPPGVPEPEPPAPEGGE